MKKYLFKCKECKTILSIETELPESNIHMVPPCPCGKSRMDYLGSDIYKYGNIEITNPKKRGGWDE